MLDVLRFWFERGVDGFRVDVLWMIAQGRLAVARQRRRTRPGHGPGATPATRCGHGDGPEMQARLRELRDVADEYRRTGC